MPLEWGVVPPPLPINILLALKAAECRVRRRSENPNKDTVPRTQPLTKHRFFSERFSRDSRCKSIRVPSGNELKWVSACSFSTPQVIFLVPQRHYRDQQSILLYRKKIESFSYDKFSSLRITSPVCRLCNRHCNYGKKYDQI